MSGIHAAVLAVVLVVSTCGASVCLAQSGRAISSEEIARILSGAGQSRGIFVRERAVPSSLSIGLTVQFELDSAELTANGETQLAELLSAMRSNELSHVAFEIIGHTDARGQSAYNMVLSRLRADRVRNFLIANGIDASRLNAQGKGATELLYPHRPMDASNRRVEIVARTPVS